MGPWSQRQLCTEGRAWEDSQGEGFANMTLQWHTKGIPKIANRHRETGARHGADHLSITALTRRSTYYHHQFFQNCWTIRCHCLSICSVRAAGSKPIEVAYIQFTLEWNSTTRERESASHLFLMWAASNVLWGETGFRQWPNGYFCVCQQNWKAWKQMSRKGPCAWMKLHLSEGKAALCTTTPRGRSLNPDAHGTL